MRCSKCFKMMRTLWIWLQRYIDCSCVKKVCKLWSTETYRCKSMEKGLIRTLHTHCEWVCIILCDAMRCSAMLSQWIYFTWFVLITHTHTHTHTHKWQSRRGMRSVDAEFVEGFLHLYEKYHKFASSGFNNHSLFSNALKEVLWLLFVLHFACFALLHCVHIEYHFWFDFLVCVRCIA